MPSEDELRKKGYPKECPGPKKCHGYGLYWIRPGASTAPYPISKEGAIFGFRTVPCLSCGANANPKGKT